MAGRDLSAGVGRRRFGRGWHDPSDRNEAWGCGSSCGRARFGVRSRTEAQWSETDGRSDGRDEVCLGSSRRKGTAGSGSSLRPDAIGLGWSVWWDQWPIWHVGMVGSGTSRIVGRCDRIRPGTNGRGGKLSPGASCGVRCGWPGASICGEAHGRGLSIQAGSEMVGIVGVRREG